MSPWENTEAAIRYIESRKRFGIKPGLERILTLLARAGNPERRLRFVHVAGTNGKGSTCAYLASVLFEAGYRVGLYTSPHLHAFQERMSINGSGIADEELESLTLQVKQWIDDDPVLMDDPPTEFEVTTAVAFLYFAAHEVDLVVLETGLGGRFDATNAVMPEVSVITNIAYDHTQILGRHLEQIAFDKAGIVKAGRPVVTAAKSPGKEVIAAVAHAEHSPLFVLGSDFFAVSEEMSGVDGQRLSYMGLHTDYYGLELGMLGAHQVENATLALGALECLAARGFPVADHAVRKGLAATRWEGRLEVVRREPLTVLDGAHNPAGAQALAFALQSIRLSSYVLVVGILADKDMVGILRPMAKGAVHVIATQANVARAAKMETVAKAAQTVFGSAMAVEQIAAISDCLERATEVAKQQGPEIGICIMGTLYTVAEARRLFVCATQNKMGSSSE